MKTKRLEALQVRFFQTNQALINELIKIFPVGSVWEVGPVRHNGRPRIMRVDGHCGGPFALLHMSIPTKGYKGGKAPNWKRHRKRVSASDIIGRHIEV